MTSAAATPLRRHALRAARLVPVPIASAIARSRLPFARVGRGALLDRDVVIRRGAASGIHFNAGWNTADYVLGNYEQPVQAALLDAVHEGDVVFDVGANAGFFSMLAARAVGPSGRVVAFEPAPDNARLIEHNTTLNAFTNVAVIAEAVSDHCGQESFRMGSFARGHALLRVGAAAPGDHVESMPVTTLDHAVASGRVPAPDFVKLDVEGAEDAAFAGMQELLAHARPVVLVEIDDADRARRDERWAAVDRMLERHDYRVEHLDAAYDLADWHVAHTVAWPRTTSRTISANDAR
jgi:FkbM family methyltransferase